jgi:hypothetical protein
VNGYITDEQSVEIEKVADEAKAAVDVRIAEFQAEIAKMQSDARRKMLDHLTQEQREKFETVFGKPIKFRR